MCRKKTQKVQSDKNKQTQGERRLFSEKRSFSRTDGEHLLKLAFFVLTILGDNKTAIQECVCVYNFA